MSTADAPERDRAVRTFDANVVVTAGAGTGKTTLLVERLVHLVVREPDPVPVTDIVALTFTNKAATELSVRFRERLQLLARAADGDHPSEASDALEEVAALVSWTKTSTAEVSRRLNGALDAVDQGHIGTIHAFAATLLRLFPLEAGVDPQFREADEAVRQDHVAEVWDAWLARELGPAAPRAELWRRLLSRVSLEELTGVALGLSAESVPLQALSDLARVSPQARRWVEEAREEARRLLAAHPDQRVIEQRLAAAARLFAAAIDGRPADVLDRDAVSSEVTSVPRGWDQKDAARAKALIRVARALSAVDHETVSLLGEVLAPFVHHCRSAFAQAGWIPFDGLLARARDLVRDHPAVREALKRRFGAMLVDECQDTDPIQYEILFFLCERPGLFATEWRRVQLTRGKLFMVGDPKQSIYGFRGADLEAYQDVVRTVQEQGGVECTLSTNFRSREAILDAVNAVGERLLRYQQGLQAGYAPIVASRDALGGRRPIVRVVRSGNGVLDAVDGREAEADRLAQWLVESVFGRVEVRSGGSVRPAEPGDVAILLRALTDVHVYLEGLRRHAIRYVVEGERRFFSTQEVVDAVNVLRVLASPYDAIALVGVLRSPLGALTDRQLHDLATAGWLDYRVVEQGDPPGAWAPVGLFRDLLSLSREILRLPVSEAVTLAFERLPLREVAASGVYGDQAAANVDKLERMAWELAAEGLSFSALVGRLSQRVRSEIEEGESPLVDEAVNAVKVLSVHKAKGLEFPIVVLAAAHSGPRTGRGPAVVRHWSSGAVGVRVGDAASFAGVHLAHEAARKEKEESRRLLYVAMTRARDLFVMSGAETGRGPAADGPAALVAEALATAWGQRPQDGSDAASVFDWEVVEAEVGHRATAPAAVASLQWPDRVALSSLWEARVARAERIAASARFLTPTRLARKDAGPRPVRIMGAPGAGERARLVGTLVHAFLQGWDYRADAASLGSAIDAFLAGRPQDGVAVTGDDLAAVLAPYVASPLYRELASARILAREVPLIMPWQDAIMEGVIDLIYERDGRLYVADYKTDSVDATTAPAAAERYRTQGEIYGRAVREAMGREVEAFHCLFLRPAVAIALPVRGRS